MGHETQTSTLSQCNACLLLPHETRREQAICPKYGSKMGKNCPRHYLLNVINKLTRQLINDFIEVRMIKGSERHAFQIKLDGDNA